jgi:AFG3 family protein
MSENDNKRGPLSPKSPQKGYQGWIIAALIATILGITYLNRTSTIRETTQKRFEKMMADKEVERVTIVNDKSVEVTLKPEALKLDKYKVVAKENNYFGGESASHYQFQVTSAETFKKDFDKIQEGVPDDDKVPFVVDTRNDWTSFLGTWGFFYCHDPRDVFYSRQNVGRSWARWPDFQYRSFPCNAFRCREQSEDHF